MMGKLAMGLSLSPATDSRLMYRERWTTHSSFCSSRIGADQADDGGLVGEDADDLGAPLDLAVEALQGIGAVELLSVRDGEGHVGQDVGLGLVEQGGELGQLGPQLIGDLAPLSPGGVGVVLSRRRRS